MEKKEEEKSEYYIGQVATQHETVVGRPDGSAMNIYEALVELLNKVDRIEKGVYGK